MTVRIQLLRSTPRRLDRDYLGVYRCRIDVGDTEDLDDKRIFVFQRNPPDPYTGVEVDEFVKVASVVDLSEFPPEAPPEDGSTPFFRKDFVIGDNLSLSEFEEYWNSINDEVAKLVEVLNVVDDLIVDLTVWHPGPPPESESSLSASE